jgi:hypothetical protein
MAVQNSVPYSKMSQGGAAVMKKSGQPSSRASDAAERSPAVYFANLKADMLLHKQLAVIKRAENNVVHRIAIDQKILFRRFQVGVHVLFFSTPTLAPSKCEIRSKLLLFQFGVS